MRVPTPTSRRCGLPTAMKPILSSGSPRRAVDDAVLTASGISLEVTLDGSVAAYAESGGVRTLARASLSALIGEAISPDCAQRGGGARRSGATGGGAGCARWSSCAKPAVDAPNEGLQQAGRGRWYRPGAAGRRIRQDCNRSRGGGAPAALKQRLRERDRGSSDPLDARADLHGAGPMQLAKIVELKAGQHEL